MSDYPKILERGMEILSKPINRAEKNKERQEEKERFKGYLKADLLLEYLVDQHPKADKLFDLAWELGHSYGDDEVRLHFADLVPLILPEDDFSLTLHLNTAEQSIVGEILHDIYVDNPMGYTESEMVLIKDVFMRMDEQTL